MLLGLVVALLLGWVKLGLCCICLFCVVFGGFALCLVDCGLDLDSCVV